MKLLIITLLFGLSLQATDPFAGKWQANFAKSPTAAQPQISKFVQDGEFLSNSNGDHSYRFKLDGHEYPAASPLFDTAIWIRTSKLRYEHETKKNGQTVYTVVTELAPDFQTRTYRNTRKLDGAVVESIQDRAGGVFDPDNPLLGDWRLRLTMEWKPQGLDYHFHAGAVSYTARLDGQDYPVSGSTTIDTVCLKRLHANSIEITGKKGSQTVYTIAQTVSPDGKTLTSQFGTRGELVYDRLP